MGGFCSVTCTHDCRQLPGLRCELYDIHVSGLAGGLQFLNTDYSNYSTDLVLTLLTLTTMTFLTDLFSGDYCGLDPCPTSVASKYGQLKQGLL